MRRWAWLVLVPLAGCFGFGEGPTLYLEFTIENLGEEGRDAGLGPHCGTARFEGDVAHIEKKSYAGIGEKRPFLIVEPDQAGPRFQTWGQEGYPLTLPAAVDPHINGTTSVLARIDYRQDRAYVDGQPVSLPHRWTETRPGDWAASFHFRVGPGTVRVFEQANCM